VQYIVLGAIVIAAIVIAVDAVRQRRRLRSKPDARRILARRVQVSGAGPDVQGLVAAGAMAASGMPVAIAVHEVEEKEPDEQEAEEALGGIWSRLSEMLDPETFRPRLAEGAEIKIFRLRYGDDYAMVATADGTAHFQLEPWEAELVQKMDGSRTVAELIVERLQEDGDLDPMTVVSLVDLLYEGGLLDPRPLDLRTALKDRLDPASPGRRRLREFGKTLKLRWEGAERFATLCYRWGLGLGFHPVGVVLVLTVSIAGIAAFVYLWMTDRFVLHLRAAPDEVAILLALGFFLTFAHELGHALALIHYRRRVLSAGFFIFFGSPAFFVDASDVLMLDGRKRIVQALAGPVAELFLAGIASIVLFLFPDASFGSLLYRFAVINYLVIIENLVPLLQLDGYWVLADLIQVPDLRPRSLAFLQSDLWHKLKKRERFTVQEIGLGLYGVVGFIFTVFSFWVGIFFWQLLFGDIVVGLWRGGIGSQLLLVVLILFFAGPLIRAGIALVRAVRKRVAGYVARIRFRVERSWRIEAAELIDDLPAFEDLDADLLSDLAGRVRLRTLPPGHAVFRQGDRPDAFYVIRSGTVGFEDEDPETGDTRQLRQMGRGESFGELGLIGAAPRQATARAVTDVQLFEVDKGTFDRLLGDEVRAPEFAPTLQAFVELRSLPAFKRLPSGELGEVLEHGEWVRYAPGTVIIEQGEPGDAFYAISSGRADVVVDDEHVRTLGGGDHFGELALLNDEPRSASVLARSTIRAFRLDREGFDRVIAEGFRREAGPRAGRNLEH
jgi:CRP-like cAMP-binding protein/Zn-dependent protease